MIPRPWYLTISACAQQNPSLAAFFEAQSEAAWRKLQPFHQVAMHPWQLHVTVFALARLTAWAHFEAEQAGIQVQAFLYDYCPQQEILADFRGVSLIATEVHCYDNGTAIQFRAADDRLENLRTALRQRLTVPVSQALAAASQKRITAEYLLSNARNSGGHIHGAVARSILSTDLAVLRWRHPINYEEPIDIRCISLIVSDDSMGNPAAYDANYCLHAMVDSSKMR